MSNWNKTKVSSPRTVILTISVHYQSIKCTIHKTIQNHNMHEEVNGSTSDEYDKNRDSPPRTWMVMSLQCGNNVNCANDCIHNYTTLCYVCFSHLNSDELRCTRHDSSSHSTFTSTILIRLSLSSNNVKI